MATDASLKTPQTADNGGNGSAAQVGAPSGLSILLLSSDLDKVRRASAWRWQ